MPQGGEGFGFRQIHGSLDECVCWMRSALLRNGQACCSFDHTIVAASRLENDVLAAWNDALALFFWVRSGL